jgi:putative transposase
MPVHKKKSTPPDDTGATPTVVSSDHLKPEDFQQYLRAEIRDATRTVMEEIMREELSQFLGAAS